MDNEEWQRALLARTGAAVKKRRTELGLTGQAVCDGCTELGFPVTASTLSKLERGNRTAASFGVIECIVLAQVLDIPPALLIFPVADTTATVSLGPDHEVSAWDATAWLTGETAMAADPDPATPRGRLEAFRSHNRAVQAALSSSLQAGERRRKAMLELDESRRTQLAKAADSYEELARQDCMEVRELRARMQGSGLSLPALPAGLAFIDADGEE